MNIFNGQSMHAYLDQIDIQIDREINIEDSNKLLGMDEVSYINYLFNKYSIGTLTLYISNQYVTYREQSFVMNEIPHNIQFMYRPTSSLKKQVISYHIPYKGEKILLDKKPSPSLMSTHDVILTNDEIIYDVVNWQNDINKIKNEANNILTIIQQQAQYLNNQIAGFNQNLQQNISNKISKRKTEILMQLNILEKLDVQVKLKSDVAPTFSIPLVRKQLIIEKPKSLTNKYNPEPTLDLATYHHILKLCYDWGVVMERAPSISRDQNEEALRDLFILLLTPHFESVTGETFNKSGKTDILIRHEGENVFIAECKFWRGEKQHHKTINQILKYLNWRDSKAAIIYFSRNKNLNPILETIQSETPNHEWYDPIKTHYYP